MPSPLALGMWEPAFWAGLAIAAVFGLIAGSFATALIHRVPRGIPWAFAPRQKDGVHAYRSACTSCLRLLSWYDLIPVFSWLSVGGRCRYCRQPIGWLYPVAEMCTLAAFIGLYISHGFAPQALWIYPVLPFLVALLFIDLERMILPDSLTVLIAVPAFLRLFFLPSWHDPAAIALEYIGGALTYGGFAWFLGWSMGRLLKKDALGFGDVKFFAVAGLWLGLSNLGVFCLLSGVAGIVFAVLWRLAGRGAVFPFGPALIMAFYLLLCLESSFLQ